MKDAETFAHDKLDVAQWRDVFSQLDALLSGPAERQNVDGDSQLSQLSQRQSARDDKVDSVVRHWAKSAPTHTKALDDILKLMASGNALITGPTAHMRLGHYRLLERIGQGGMGSVWRAERTDGLYQAQVAIKLLGTLALSGHARARFALEGQILARLTHVNIARLLDAGTTDDGQRFLVIELIEGAAINEYVTREKLTVDARLRLFRQLLDAVAFAHERLVIHRDIKPANIVVTAAGEVKLLDFGVAKLLVDNNVESSLTQLHGSAYTEAYAAPEQVRGQPPAVAADVFSLGMILFELVTGKRAVWAQPKSSLQRGARADHMSTIMPADLAAVIGKALEVAPEDRYRSVAALDDDLRRLLANEPVTAHSAGTMSIYLLAKFARRHRVGVATTLAVMLAVVTGASVTTWQWRDAKAQAARAEAVQEFMAKLFEENDPENARGTPLTAQQLLERGAARVVIELKNQPDVLAELQVRIGGIYNALGEHEKARPHLQSAIAYFESTGRTAATPYLDALFSLTECDVDGRQYDSVRVVAGKLRAAAKASVGEPNKWLGNTLGQMSWAETKTGDAVRGESLAREAIAQQREWAKGGDADGLGIANNLIEALIYQGKFVEARAVAASKVAEGPTLPHYKVSDLLVDRYTLARLDFILNRYAQTAIELQSLVGEMERNMGVKHPRTVTARNLLAQTLVFAGYESEGVAVQRANVLIAQSRETADEEAVAFERAVLAKLLLATAQPAAAQTEADELLAVMTKNYPKPTWNRERARWIVGDAQLHQRKFAEARQTLSLVISNMQSLTAFAQNPGFAEALQSRALLGHAQRHSAAALNDISEACAIFEKKLPAGSAQATRCALYAAWIASKQFATDAERASVARVLPQLKTQVLALIPEGHAQRVALAEILKSIESTSDNGAANHVREWPISLVDPLPTAQR